MGTKIRPAIVKTHKYWISKHRYYELKHFCLQYPEWKKAYAAIDETLISSQYFDKIPSNNRPADTTAKYAEAKIYYADRMQIIEDSAKEADPDLWVYILRAVTEELSFTYLKTKLEIPCGKDMYYDRYRKFFWILSKKRQ